MNRTDPPTFSNPEEKARWIEDTLADFRDSTAAPDDIASLRVLLLEDADARRIYWEANELSCLLEQAGSEQNSTPQPRLARSRKVIAWAATGIAAALVAGFWVASQNSTPEPVEDPVLARVSSSHDAVWGGADRVDGACFESETLELRSGIAEITFSNGARFVMKGPCELEIVDRDTVLLGAGNLWGHCPPAARGFEVLAPGGHRVVDLGTEFGVKVEPSGATDVHVFDGEVEVFPNASDKLALGAGLATRIEPGGQPVGRPADFSEFTNSEDLQRERGRVHHENLLARDDLLIYFNFKGDQGTATDKSISGLTGRIAGPVSVSGRLPAERSLLFERPRDAVSLDFGETLLDDDFTVAMWIKPDALSKSHTALLNSGGFEPGAFHFQVSDDGALMVGVSEIVRYHSEDGVVEVGEWQLVATSWNRETRRGKLFYNGKELPINTRPFQPSDPNAIANFGSCELGNWAKPTYRHRRNFVGRIDELMVFSKSLSAEEMAQLYASSRP